MKFLKKIKFVTFCSILLVFFAATVSLLPSSVYAICPDIPADCPGGVVPPGTPSPSNPPSPGSPSGTQNGFPKLENPLGDTNIGSLQDFVVKAIDMIFKIMLPIAALFIIYAGFQMVMASGNEEKLKAAKDRLLYTLLGVLIILGAWVIANAIAGTVDSVIKPS